MPANKAVRCAPKTHPCPHRGKRARRKRLLRRAVLDRVLGDGLDVQRALEAMRRDFLLGLSAGFVYDCLGRELSRLDLPERRRRTLENFSGVPCVDEPHLGGRVLLSCAGCCRVSAATSPTPRRGNNSRPRREKGRLNSNWWCGFSEECP